jgi:exodeoxyribonuclease VII large subunit
MALDFDAAEPVTVRPALTVSALNRAVAGLLERSFPLVLVRGEVANLTRAASGHWYFSLKDDACQVRCVMFRARNQLLDWMPRDGDEVEVSAVVAFYQPRGEFQLGIEFMRRAGQGRLFEEFVRLKERLAAEGLFASELKRPLPRVPRRVGIVTSTQAAALRDVLTTLRRRAPYAGIVVYPVPVQGAGAAPRIAAMLERVSQRSEVDIVLLVRGGGSIEDLWAFNEEAVARAIRASSLPVVVGVGHESDITIADFAADLRAPTPTAAAELVAPARDALLAELGAHLRPLRRCLLHRLRTATQQLDYAQRSVVTPRAPLAALNARVVAARTRMSHVVDRQVAVARARCDLVRQRLRPLPALGLPARANVASLQLRLRTTLAAQAAALRTRAAAATEALALLDPGRVLTRGYSVVRTADGRVVRTAAELSPGVRVELEFSRGSADAVIERLRSD